jgi:hypothetical protein
MRSIRFAASAAAALLVIASAPPLAAAAKPRRVTMPVCEEVLATADTTWIADPGVEVGQVAGLINGGVFLKYSDTDPTGSESKVNLVITSKTGDLDLLVSGESSQQDDDTVVRKLFTVEAFGTGAYQGAKIDLTIGGLFYLGKGGSYQISGTICRAITPTSKPRR